MKSYDHITMLTAAMKYFDWLMYMGLEETNEIFELEYLQIARRFDVERMKILVESIESKMK